jgi:hypothetical protein
MHRLAGHEDERGELGKTDAEIIQILENSGYKVHKFHKESEAACISILLI